MEVVDSNYENNERRKDGRLRSEVRQWVELVTGKHFETETEFIASLREGILLCELINLLRPDTVRKVHLTVTGNCSATQNFKKMENIENFRKGCLQLGLKTSDLFNTLDLFEQKDLNTIFVTLFLLRMAYEKKDKPLQRSVSLLEQVAREAATRPSDVREAPGPLTLSRSNLLYDERNYQLKVEKTRQWIQDVLGENLTTTGTDFIESLKDGVTLCKLTNKLLPDAVPMDSLTNQSLSPKERIETFKRACLALGLPQDSIFKDEDLCEGKDGKPAVLSCLRSLANHIAKQSTYRGPILSKSFSKPSRIGGAKICREPSVHQAIKNGALLSLGTTLKENPSNLNQLNFLGQNILHMAAIEGQLQIMVFILNNFTQKMGVKQSPRIVVGDRMSYLDVNAKDQEEFTALHYFVRWPWKKPESPVILSLLLSRGASLEDKNKYGETALQIATSSLQEETILALLDAGANVNACNFFGETCLHKAGRLADTSPSAIIVFNLLLSYHADISICGAHGSALELIAPEKRNLIRGIAPEMLNLQDDATDGTFTDSTQRVQRLINLVAKKSVANLFDLKGNKKQKSEENIPEVAAKIALLSQQLSKEVFEPPPSLDTPAVVEVVSFDTSDNVHIPVIPTDGYRIELGKEITPEDKILDLDIAQPFYKTHFIQKKHYNFVGSMGSEDNPEPVVISVVESPESVPSTSFSLSNSTSSAYSKIPSSPSSPSVTELQYRILYRTKDGSNQYFISASKVNGGSKATPEDVLKVFLNEKATQFSNAKLHQVDSKKLVSDLIEFEDHDPQKTICFPVGVVYAAEGQKTAKEMWGNEQGSDEFEKFLAILGDKVRLLGWSGYAGGLDVKSNTRGEYSVYTRWNGLHIMFHVSTLLPFDPRDDEKLARSRVIGNDISMIIFKQGNTPYSPSIMTGAVSHTFVLVSPQKQNDKTAYRVAAVSKSYVPPFKPEIPDPPLFEDGQYFRDFLIAKVINGHRAAQKSKGLIYMYNRPRKVLLQEILNHYKQKRKLNFSIGRKK